MLATDFRKGQLFCKGLVDFIKIKNRHKGDTTHREK